MTDQSTFLYATPSVTEGAGRLLDFADTLTQYNSSPTPEIADALALALDWCAIGDDLRDAVLRFVDAHQHELAGVIEAEPAREQSAPQ